MPVAICCDNTTVSRTNQVTESARAARAIGIEAVEQIHRAGRRLHVHPAGDGAQGRGRLTEDVPRIRRSDRYGLEPAADSDVLGRAVEARRYFDMWPSP